MPKFELKDATSNKFWEIELNDESVTARFGRIGTTGQETNKEYDTRVEAKREYDKLIAEKIKKGWVLVDAGGGDAPPSAHRNAELESAIEAAPEDASTFLAYGEWLRAAGDLRGELILLQAGMADDPALGEKAEQLIKDHAGYFYGDFADLVGTTLKVTWRLGFLDTVRIGGGDGGKRDLRATIEHVLKHPSGRFLRGLTLAMLATEGDHHYEDLIEKLAMLGHKPTLRSLLIGDRDHAAKVAPADVAKLWEVYPNLETLELQGAAVARTSKASQSA